MQAGSCVVLNALLLAADIYFLLEVSVQVGVI